MHDLTTSWPQLEHPRVSVVICNYNYGHFLDAAIRSAINQTERPEVIVVDDGSTDGSSAILAEWAHQVQVVRQTNQGQRAAYNTGLAHSSGDVVLFLDSDDLLEPQAVAVVSKSFQAGVVKVHFPLSLIDQNGASLGISIPSVLGEGDVFTALLRHGVLYGSPPGSGNAYRRAVLERLFPLPVSPVDKVAADFFPIYASAAYGRVVAVREPLGRYRLHEGGGDSTETGAFGNAVQHVDIDQMFERVYEEFHAWLTQRSDGEFVPPRRLKDFSRLKNRYAKAILSTQHHPLRSGAVRQLPELWRALWYRRDYRVHQKTLVSLWALLLLLGPRSVVRPITRYLLDPASRGRKKLPTAT